ncbi:blue copper protein-like [Phoenix dactylifera]|uniref:Blue copper protein-like n=1 Tax=Phoenix dactylifera TaxID=42345 RepID=A0A8B7CH04_PHODC|nr:blue copper protein-like [Phoenix dactylifera]
MAGVTALLVLLIAAVPAYASEYTVGDSQGWTSGVDYSTWVSDKTFKVGDTLLFQYGFLHSVDEVSESDYKACSTSNSMQSFSDQNTKIALSKPGTRYFICGTSGHCSGGMKLAVAVSGSSTSPSTPSSPEGSTPSPLTPSTPSNGDQPSSKTPATTTTTKINGATGSGFYCGSALLLGMLLVLGHALMG